MDAEDMIHGEVAPNQDRSKWFNQDAVVRLETPDPAGLRNQILMMHLNRTGSIMLFSFDSQIDWLNPEGDKCPYDLSKPLPLQGPPWRTTIPMDFFFNKDLEYLKTEKKEKKYASSLTKSKAARGVTYLNKSNLKISIRDDELYKFSDGTLKLVHDTLNPMLHNFVLGYNNECMPNRAWSEKDQKQTSSMFGKYQQDIARNMNIEEFRVFCCQNQRDLPRDTPIDRVEVLRVILFSFSVMNRNSSSINIKQHCGLRKKYRLNLKNDMPPRDKANPDDIFTVGNKMLYLIPTASDKDSIRLLSATITLIFKAEDPISFTFNKWYQSLVRSFDQEKNKTKAQQKNKMVKTSSSLKNEPCCSKYYKKNTDSLNSKTTQLTDKLSDMENMLYHYKLASKDLDRLLESQRSDKNKKGLGYSVVPPPPAQIYSPPKKDMSWTGLPEFADDIVTDYSRPTPTVETADCTEVKTNKVEAARKSFVRYAEMCRRTSKSLNRVQRLERELKERTLIQKVNRDRSRSLIAWVPKKGGLLGIKCSKSFPLLVRFPTASYEDPTAKKIPNLDPPVGIFSIQLGSLFHCDFVSLNLRINSKKSTMYHSFGSNEEGDHVRILQSCNGLLRLNIKDNDHPIMTTLDIPHGLHRGRNFLGWSIQTSVWSICLGEGEEDAFVVINISRKVVNYNIISKTTTEIFDIGSNQMDDDDDDDDDAVEFIPPFEVDPNIYEFILSLDVYDYQSL
uniref:Uncharacterized protein n=1 Tax=Tanacetum cinerariifolium TaxID=118510 RepID=A0A6L2NH67_TANCI|nr:hypothetical protein [Tanacetum cinerariifolium]